jgi:hypothetical protein
MAEDIHAGMQRWLGYVQDFHIDQWADERQLVLDQAEELWHARAQNPEDVERLPTHLDHLHAFTTSLAADRTVREGETLAIPDGAHLMYDAWDAAHTQHAESREPDAEAQGRAAEQRFFQEQDPQSVWYREDLYHGAPGPDMESPEARQARQYDAWDVERPRETTSREPAVDRSPFALETVGSVIEIDTSDTNMGERWQEQLAALDARIDALVTHGAAQEPEQGYGME